MPYRLHRRLLARAATLVIAFLALTSPARVYAQLGPGQAAPGSSDSPDGKPIIPPGLEDVGVDEHLDGQLPMDAIFRDSDAKMVRFGDLFDGKRPVVLTLAYHTCPTVCSMVLSQTVESLKKVDWSIGDQYTSITLSFDSREKTERADAKKKSLVGDYGRASGGAGASPSVAAGWTFLTGDDANIHRVTDAVGFKYHYVEREQQYAHPTVIVILKPNGQVARYLYGLEYSPTDVKLGLLEASNGNSIRTIDKVLLYCYHYDPNAGRYVLLATRVMQIGGIITALLLGGFLSTMWLRERAKTRLATANP